MISAAAASQLRAREPLCRGKQFVGSAESFDACATEGSGEAGASGSVYGAATPADRGPLPSRDAGGG